MLDKLEWNKMSYKKTEKWAIGITCISLIEHCISLFWQNYNFLEPLRLLVLFIGVFVVPIVMYAAWGICIIQYLKQRYFICKKEDNLQGFLWTFFCVAFMVFAGIYAINNFKNTISYVAENRNLLNGLYHCLWIKISITVGWLFCFICCAKCNETEEVWLKKMTEYYSEQGIGPDVAPFFRK